MAAQIITKEDLDEFREQLLKDLKAFLGRKPEEPGKWLKSYQVKHMLRILRHLAEPPDQWNARLYQDRRDHVL